MMVVLRRWSIRIVGLYSNKVLNLDFCRFYTRAGAEGFARKIDSYSIAKDVTRVEAYRRPWTGRK